MKTRTLILILIIISSTLLILKVTDIYSNQYTDYAIYFLYSIALLLLFFIKKKSNNEKI
jgi:hypothetical protein|tara:strand:+ start:699 stop:875 length:177 start_codon:yes stop_codon:yes gene_type:complete